MRHLFGHRLVNSLLFRAKRRAFIDQADGTGAAVGYWWIRLRIIVQNEHLHDVKRDMVSITSMSLPSDLPIISLKAFFIQRISLIEGNSLRNRPDGHILIMCHEIEFKMLEREEQ